MINQNQAASFEKVATAYEKGRVGYPDNIYKIIELYTKLNSDSSILEVGCGNGVATEEIFNYFGSTITAIDPGLSLLEIAKSKVKNEKIIFMNTDFEDLDIDEPVDAIFSATAFHWIDKRNKYTKSYHDLKNDGSLVLYWNNYGIDDEKAFHEIQNIYSQYHPNGTPETDVRQLQREKIEDRKKEIINIEFFSLLVHHESVHKITMNSEEYVNLLKSFSNNSVLPHRQISQFYTEITKYIQSKEDKISVKITVNLEIAKKNGVLK